LFLFDDLESDRPWCVPMSDRDEYPGQGSAQVMRSHEQVNGTLTCCVTTM
jgi:hypothetical protein